MVACLQMVLLIPDYFYSFAISAMTTSLGQKIVWDDLSRGFHGGLFISNEIETFNFTDEIQRLRFEVRQYTSDRTDFFGTYCDAWEIILTLKDIRSAEYEVEGVWRIGIDYARAEYAKEFCEYALESIKKHGNISRLPLSEMVEED